VSVDDFVLARGMRDTRVALRRWNADPWPVLSRWAVGAFAVACALLLAVWVIAVVAPIDLTSLYIPGVTGAPEVEDVGRILARNGLVLALHAVACVAGFIAGSSIVLEAQRRTGFSRWVHEKARPIALGWVVLVTCFSLITQAYALGLTAAQLSGQLAISPGALVMTVVPHAIPELVAVFLPLAAWTIASRRDRWDELLAATFATVAVAIPILVLSATWEIYVWPHLLEAVSPLY
jgi:uncharacterized membrane protein